MPKETKAYIDKQDQEGHADLLGYTKHRAEEFCQLRNGWKTIVATATPMS